MMEFYAVYDKVSGDFQWKAQGPKGAAQLQAIDEDFAIIEMPFEAWKPLPLEAGPVPFDSLGPLKRAVQALVDDAAGRFRRNFITDIPGQAETYLYKANEARAWQADNAIETYFLAPEAAARGMAVAALAAEVLANEAAWRPIGGRVEALRVAAKAAIEAAETIGAIVAAAQVEWSDALAGVPAEAA